MVASCGHPERPLIAMLLPEQRLHTSSSSTINQAANRPSNPFPIVHAGDLVQILAQEKNLRMEIAGKAEESGVLGSKVRVRSLNSAFDIGHEQTFVGIVRGPGKIEILP
jgi:flagella basal body P-ring formation protein FlgA